MHTLRTWPLFALAVLVTLGLAGFYSLMVGLMALGLGFLLPGPFAQMTHFTEAHHRTHDLTFGFLFLPVVVGMVAQLRQPLKNLAGQMMALVPALGLLLILIETSVLANGGILDGHHRTSVLQPPWVTVGLTALAAAVLHPAAGHFTRAYSVTRINRVLLAMVAVAAVPLVASVATNVNLQVQVLVGKDRIVIDDHAIMGHYGFMAAYGLVVIAVGLLASLRPVGWRPTAWVAGLLPALLGLTSLVYPNATSSLGTLWAIASIAWGCLFIVAAERVASATVEDTLLATRLADTGATGDAPLWAKVFAITVLTAVVLFLAQALFGAGGHGPGRHLPSGDAGGQTLLATAW